MNKKTKTEDIILFSLLYLFIVWLALMVAPYIHGGAPHIIVNFDKIIDSPLSIYLVEDTPKTILIFSMIYMIAIIVYYSSQRNYRRTKEYGSATWGGSNKINKKYEDKETNQNKLLSQNVKMGLDGKKHRRNLNSTIVGGSGSGKTRFYAKPNIMECNSSLIILDSKGEILRDVGNLLEMEGYVIKVVDLINMDKSHGYNPFHYIQSDKEVLMLITNLIKNTTPKNASTNDPFWEKAETALLQALCLYLLQEAPEEEQNFAMVMELLVCAEVKEEDEEYQSPLDELFDELETTNPTSLALKQYKIYKQAAGKTAKSILVSVGVRLAAFNLDSVASMTMFDELELDKIGDRKTALFAIIPDNDSSFNFLVGMLYTQLFQTLYYQADYIHGGQLPIPVHFMMDEFANVALPDDFDKLLSTMRSRVIFVSIILQNLAQLKALFKDSWESIIGNCDELIYLGGNEQSTHKFISEYLGKETLDTNTYAKSTGKSGNYSTNYQQVGRELLTPDEVRLLDNEYALIFIRGELPIIDKKIDILKHRNIKYTKDGGVESFKHGTILYAIDNWQDIELSNDKEYELLSEEDLERRFFPDEFPQDNNYDMY